MEPIEVMVACLQRLEARHGCFKMEMGFGQVVGLIGQVQLALRHPGNQGPTADAVRELVEAMIGALEASEPELGPLLRMGFDPAHDR